jgi:hypothetical protein
MTENFIIGFNSGDMQLTKDGFNPPMVLTVLEMIGHCFQCRHREN